MTGWYGTKRRANVLGSGMVITEPKLNPVSSCMFFWLNRRANLSIPTNPLASMWANWSRVPGLLSTLMLYSIRLPLWRMSRLIESRRVSPVRNPSSQADALSNESLAALTESVSKLMSLSSR